jgi:hypothetical protein
MAKTRGCFQVTDILGIKSCTKKKYDSLTDTLSCFSNHADMDKFIKDRLDLERAFIREVPDFSLLVSPLSDLSTSRRLDHVIIKLALSLGHFPKSNTNLLAIEHRYWG